MKIAIYAIFGLLLLAGCDNSCSKDARICPDGTVVHRVPPGCDFEPCPAEKEEIIGSFEECMEAGNPIMESYPRQCRAGDEVFTEKIKDIGPAVTIEEAICIAEQSECVHEGQLTETFFYNENSKTWWIELDADREGCNPACVVSEVTKTAEINWRCTGLLPE